MVSISKMHYFSAPKHAWSKKPTVPTESIPIQHDESDEYSGLLQKNSTKKYSYNQPPVHIPTDMYVWKDSYTTDKDIESAIDDEIALLMEEQLSTSPGFEVQIIFYKGFVQ